MDNTTDEPDRTATVTATLGNSQGTGTVSGATLTLTDNDAAPGVTLSVASSPIPENGGSTSGEREADAPVERGDDGDGDAGVGVVHGEFVGTRRSRLLRGETANATDTAAIAAVDNDVDAADNAVTVTGTAQNSQGAGTVTGASLTITDDGHGGVRGVAGDIDDLPAADDGGMAGRTPSR